MDINKKAEYILLSWSKETLIKDILNNMNEEEIHAFVMENQ